MSDQIGSFARRYTFKLYPDKEQKDELRRQTQMVADLWNAILHRCEEIRRRTVQTQVWTDSAGKRHTGKSTHSLTWTSYRYKSGEVTEMRPDEKGFPAQYNKINLSNEITWLCNSLPEWRELSVWVAHRTAKTFSLALDAFYRKMKELSNPTVYQARAQQFLERSGRMPTRYELAGWPRFKRFGQHNSVPHRFASGCRLTKDQRHRQSWSLQLKGIDGAIHARGDFPSKISKWTDADVIWRDGNWWISICVEAVQRRFGHGTRHFTIAFDLVDSFVLVNGIPETPQGVYGCFVLQDTLDRMKSERDLRWPNSRRLRSGSDGYEDYQKACWEIGDMAGLIARRRSNALHVWTSRLVERADDITIIAPPNIRDATATPRGNVKHWGAQVETASLMNRNVLAMAPGMAIKMLQYKAEEAGIRCDIVEDDAPNVAINRELVTTGKQLRQARRITRKETA